MQAKKVFKLIFQLSEYQNEKLYEIAGRLGLTVPELIEMIIDEITGDAPDNQDEHPIQAWLKKMINNAEPSFLSYLLELAYDKHEDIHELCYCILFLREKQHQIRMVNAILHHLNAAMIEEMDEATLTELKWICEEYGVEIDENDRESILDCLEDEKEALRADMKACDLGNETEGFYSALDAVQQAFDEYRNAYDKQDADINDEVQKVIKWLDANEKSFQPLK